MKLNRNVKYRLYPTAKQLRELDRHCLLHRRLYNAALEERISAYQKAGQTISYFDQTKSLTQIRADDPEYRELSASALRCTLHRLHLAYGAFFRRVKAGEKAGFPRFKSAARFKGFGFRQADGFKFAPGEDKHGRLNVKGIPGTIKARGGPRQPFSEIRCAELSFKAGKWFLTVGVLTDEKRQSGVGMMAFDWGVKTLASGVTDAGDTVIVDNDRVGQRDAKRIAVMQRRTKRMKRGSNRWRKLQRAVAKAKEKTANRRRDRAHKISAEWVQRFAIIATEKLQIGNMTRSAKGSEEKPGKRVKQKAGLNREILDTAPAMLRQMVEYKAESAGTWFIEAPTRTLKPSQTCPACGLVEKKTLNQRGHHCACGYADDRDIAAARVVLQWAQSEIKAAA